MKRFSFRCELSAGGQNMTVDTVLDAEDIQEANDLRSDFRRLAGRLGIDVLEPVVVEVPQTANES